MCSSEFLYKKNYKRDYYATVIEKEVTRNMGFGADALGFM